MSRSGYAPGPVYFAKAIAWFVILQILPQFSKMSTLMRQEFAMLRAFGYVNTIDPSDFLIRLMILIIKGKNSPANEVMADPHRQSW
jgi:hypothetical protein